VIGNPTTHVQEVIVQMESLYWALREEEEFVLACHQNYPRGLTCPREFEQIRGLTCPREFEQIRDCVPSIRFFLYSIV